MGRKRKRSPALAMLLLVITLTLAVRSLWVGDFVRWQSVDDSDHRSLIRTTFGLRTALLGLGFAYEQKIFLTRTPRDVDTALEWPGLSYVREELPDHPPFARRLGFGLERSVDERPESFRNTVELTIPLWLIGMLLAIGPVRWLIARRALARAPSRQAASDDAGVAGTSTAGRSRLKTAIIALLLGVVIGAAAVALYSSSGSRSVATTAPSTTAPAPEQPPIHPIVGRWRIRMGDIRASYHFANDGSFVVQFTGLPTRPAAPKAAHDAGGTWRVNGKELILTNTWSNTPLVVVNERETATILSVEPETLTLEHADRKGRNEVLEFERFEPFQKGRVDMPAVVGMWKLHGVTLALKEGGEATMTYDRAGVPARAGTWSQAGKKLTLLMEPPYVKSAARRAADPTLTEPREQSYDVRSVDDLRMILHPEDSPPTENHVYERVTRHPKPPESPGAGAGRK